MDEKRKILTITEFSEKTGISTDDLRYLLENKYIFALHNKTTNDYIIPNSRILEIDNILEKTKNDGIEYIDKIIKKNGEHHYIRKNTLDNIINL